MSSEPKRQRAGRGRRGRDKERVFAAIVSRFADAVARFRGRRGEITWTTEVHLWDDDDDEGGLAASGVRRRPPDRSGSGSAALPEPTEDESSDSGFYTRPGT